MIDLKKLGLSRLMEIPAGYYLLLIQFFMFINTEVFFPENTDFYHNLILGFLVSFTLMIAIPDIRIRLFKVPIKKFILKFVMGFFGGFVVLGAMNSIFSSTGISFGQVNIGILMLNIFIIASVEELIFRNMLVSKFGVVIAGIIFGVFHIVAYSYSLPRMIYAIIMHFVLYYIQKTFSRDSSSVNSGVHASINYFAYMNG